MQRRAPVIHFFSLRVTLRTMRFYKKRATKGKFSRGMFSLMKRRHKTRLKHLKESEAF